METLAAVLAGLLLAWLGFVALVWFLRPRSMGLRDLVRLLPDIIRLIGRLLGDPATPRGARLALLGLLAWLISPIDVIPEFIPVLGPLDDVVVAVLVLRYVRRRVGEQALRREWSGSPEGFEVLLGIVGREPAAR